MKLLSSVLFSFLFLLQSCSSSKRVKERPDFTATGAAATQEIKKFKLAQITTAQGRFESEDLFTYADGEKLKPFMHEISPKSVEMLEATKPKEKIYWIIFAAWISTIFIKDSDGNISPLYWYGFGATLGYGFYLNVQRNNVSDQFNEDLKAKFASSVGYNFKF